MHQRDADTYLANPDIPLPNVVAIGWLAIEAEFPIGDPDPVWLDKLACIIGRENVAQTRGYHYCPFCSEEPALPRASGRTSQLGSAETWVPSTDGSTVFAAPNLIHHYISQHHYMPPQAYIDAVAAFDLASAWMGDPVLEQALKRHFETRDPGGVMTGEERNAWKCAMASDIENLWRDLRPMLEASAARIVALEPVLYQQIGKNSNDSFPLRVYLSFMKDRSQGDEIVVSVDLVYKENGLSLTSDVAHESEILADGPGLELVLDNVRPDLNGAFAGWLIDFEQFLKASEAKIVTTARERLDVV